MSEHEHTEPEPDERRDDAAPEDEDAIREEQEGKATEKTRGNGTTR